MLCVDSTISMGGGTANIAYAGMAALCECAAASGVSVRYGGIKFGDVISDTFPLTTDKAAFVAWLAEPDIGYDGGTDGPENPLAALLWAASQSDAAFVLLATDDVYHYAGDPFHGGALCPVTSATQASVTSALSAVHARVFIDPGSSQRALYGPLAVNGRVEDYLGTYSFARLRAEFTEDCD